MHFLTQNYTISEMERIAIILICLHSLLASDITPALGPVVGPAVFKTLHVPQKATKSPVTSPGLEDSHGLILPLSESLENQLSLTKPHTGTRSDLTQSVKNNTTFAASIMITSVLCSLAPIFIPVNMRAFSSFINISRNKQPMFLLFGSVHVICMVDLLVGLVEGVSLWLEVPDFGCQILGGCQVTIFFGLSSTLSTVCIYRIAAVVKPRLYKKFAKRSLILKLIAGILTFSLLLPVVLTFTNTLNFRYVGPPHSTGCSLFMVRDWFHVYGSLLNMVIIFINLLLANTYFILHRYFGTTISKSEHVRAMRKGALFVTSLSTICYFLCHLPTVIIYIILGFNDSLILHLVSPYRLILDFVLLLCPHLYSCVLPLCLVTGNTLERVQTAARNTHQSRIRSLQRPNTRQ